MPVGWLPPTTDERLAWVCAALFSVSVAVSAASSPASLLLAGGILIAGALAAVAFVQPRWVLLLQLALVIGYLPDVFGPRSGLPVTEYTLVLLLSVAVLFRWLLGRERPARVSEAALFAALLAAMVLSAAAATDRSASLADLKQLIASAALVLLMVGLLDQPHWLRRAMWAVVVSAAGLAAIAVFQQLTKTYDVDYFGLSTILEDRTLRRSAGPHDANYFGAALVMGAALALYLFLAARRAFERAAALGALAACLAAAFFTYSRGAVVALAVSLVAAAALRRVRPWIPLAGAVLLIGLAAVALPSDVKTRFRSVFAPVGTEISYMSDESLANRFAENLVAVQMFRDRPLLGVGPENYPVHYFEYAQQLGLDTRVVASFESGQRPHNLYLETLAELGVVGAAALLSIVWLAVSGAWRARARLPTREGLLAEGVFVALIGFLAASLFLHLSYPRYLWVPVGLALVAGRLAEKRVTEPASSPLAAPAA